MILDYSIAPYGSAGGGESTHDVPPLDGQAAASQPILDLGEQAGILPASLPIRGTDHPFGSARPNGAFWRAFGNRQKWYISFA